MSDKLLGTFQETAYPIPGGGMGFLTVDNSEANSHTYVYEPDKDLHQMTLEAFPSEKNFEVRATHSGLMVVCIYMPPQIYEWRRGYWYVEYAEI